MIKDLENKFQRYEKSISTYIGDRVDTYFGHEKFAKLKDRVKSIDNSLDLRFGKDSESPRNRFKTSFVIPLARETFVAQRAISFNAFLNDPIFTISPTGTTPRDSSSIMQITLNRHLKKMLFRQTALSRHIDQCSRYGASVNVAQFNVGKRTVNTTVPNIINGQRFGYTQKMETISNPGVHNERISVLNFFCNPHVPDIEKSDYKGYIDSVPLSSFVAFAKNNPVYIKKNVISVIKEAKNGTIDDENYHGDTSVDINHISIHMIKGYFKLNISGNEDDDTEYYVEKIGETIVRMHRNYNEGGYTGIDTMYFDKRPNAWYGNASNETQIPMENVLHTVLQMEADTALKRLQNYIFYNKDMGVDVSKINEYAKNGAFIPFSPRPGQPPNQQLFQQYSFNDQGYRGIEYIINEVKEASQRTKTRPDMFRGVNKGGMKNSTATAVNEMKAEGDVVENFFLYQFSYGLQGIGTTNIFILKENLGNYFNVREREDSDPIEVAKEEILGEHLVGVETSLTKNNQIQAMNLLNVLTSVQNFKGSQDPSWQNVDMTEVAREWIKTVAPNFDTERIFPGGQQAPPQQQLPMEENQNV